MAKMPKRYAALRAKVDSNKLYALDDALALVKECAVAKFDESIDVAVSLGVDTRKSDQVVRGSVVLPAGTGKIKRSHTSRGHLLGGKSRKRKRHLRKSVVISSANINHISPTLPR